MESLECEPREFGYVREITEPRSEPWFKKYNWSVSWHQPEISAIRGIPESFKIHKILASRRNWEKTRFDNTGAWTRNLKPSFLSKITPEVERNAIAVAEYLRQSQTDYKLVIGSDYITVYTNAQEFVNATINVAKQITQGPITVKSAEI